MIHGNAKQWWVRLLPVLLPSLTFALTFHDFEDLPNETLTYDTDVYPSPHYEQLYNRTFMLDWIDRVTNNRTCQESWSCSNAPQNNSSKVLNKFCFCDDLCIFFGDCCEDRFTRKQIRNEGGVERTESDMKLIEKGRLDTHLYKCTYNWDKGNFEYRINACPKEYTNLEFRRQCEHPQPSDRLLHVPVSGFLPGCKDGTLPIRFKNFYCALCHNVSDYEFWQPQYECSYLFSNMEFLGNYSDRNYSIEFIENRLKCKLRFYENPLKGRIRDCFPIDKGCHNEAHEDLKSKCNQGPFQPVVKSNFINYNIYRNIHCAFCNSIYNILFSRFSCIRSDYRFTLDGRRPTFSSLYNFNILKTTCGKHAIYDIYKGFCREIHKSHASKENGYNGHDPTAPYQRCKLIKLDENEYRQSGDSIYFQEPDRSINKSLLHFIDDKPYICADHLFQNNQSTYMFDKIEVYITTIGLTLSILALLMTFSIYACFRSLRNVPGKMSMNLVASMFLASLLFFFSNESLADEICTVIAVCIHYTYLVSFFWMNALSFDAWHTFSKSTIERRSKHCYIYCLIYCWITPLLIVSLSIFVQFTPFDIFPSWLSPKYGLLHCWISSKWSLLIFFAAPLFLLVLCNVVFYTLTIRAIYRTEKLSDRMLSKKNKGMFLIYLKLCFIMGINWVFALLHTFTGIAIIRYISVFLNSFQGFWVGCSYLFSKQVCRQLKEKLAFMCRSTEHTDSDLSGSKQTSGTYVSGTKAGNSGEKFMGKV